MKAKARRHFMRRYAHKNKTKSNLHTKRVTMQLIGLRRYHRLREFHNTQHIDENQELMTILREFDDLHYEHLRKHFKPHMTFDVWHELYYELNDNYIYDDESLNNPFFKIHEELHNKILDMNNGNVLYEHEIHPVFGFGDMRICNNYVYFWLRDWYLYFDTNGHPAVKSFENDPHQFKDVISLRYYQHFIDFQFNYYEHMKEINKLINEDYIEHFFFTHHKRRMQDTFDIINCIPPNKLFKLGGVEYQELMETF